MVDYNTSFQYFKYYFLKKYNQCPLLFEIHFNAKTVPLLFLFGDSATTHKQI